MIVVAAAVPSGVGVQGVGEIGVPGVTGVSWVAGGLQGVGVSEVTELSARS